MAFLRGNYIMQKRARGKTVLCSEAVYLTATVLLALAVAMLTAADFGISMVVAPAYLLSLKTGFLTFGQAEYVIQAGLFIVFCIVMGKFKPAFLSSFVSCLIYGAVLDLWRRVPLFDPEKTAPGSMAVWLRAVMFASGVVLTALSIAMFYKTYLYPQVYDFFVKGVGLKFGIKTAVFKTGFDIACLVAAVVMSLVFFGKLEAISWGTFIMALINGSIIGFFCNIIDKYFELKPAFKGLARHFELD